MREIRILVAEDNDDHMVLTKIALRRITGVQVTVIGVPDGAQALDYLNGRGDFADAPLPDLFLLDLSIPKRSGLEVLQEVKDDRRLSQIPVIILSSSDRPEDVAAAYALGANSFVTKSADISLMAEYWTKTVTLVGIG
jgi:CheY-like chemotaxis protein